MIVTRKPDKYYGDIVELVKQFYDEALNEYDDLPIDEQFLVASFDKYKDNAFLLIDDGKCVGVLVGQVMEDVLNGSKVFHEIIWYVDQSHRKYGVYLLKIAMDLLKEDGFSTIVMVCLHNSKTEKLFRLYERMGFKAMETHFIKPLTGEQDA